MSAEAESASARRLAQVGLRSRLVVRADYIVSAHSSSRQRAHRGRSTVEILSGVRLPDHR